MAGQTNLSRMAKVSDDEIYAIRKGRELDDVKSEALRSFAAKVTTQPWCCRQ